MTSAAHQATARTTKDRTRALRRRRIVVMAAVLAFGLPGPATPARAEPTADQVLADIGLSARDKQQVMNGEFVTPRVEPVSERDLPVRLVFLVKSSPDAFVGVLAGDLITADPQVQAWGRLGQPGSLADLAALNIGSDVARQLHRAQAGTTVNLATSEIAAFNAVDNDSSPTVRGQLHRICSPGTRPIALPVWRASRHTTADPGARRISLRTCAKPANLLPARSGNTCRPSPPLCSATHRRPCRACEKSSAGSATTSTASRPTSWSTCCRPPRARPGWSSSASTTSRRATTGTRRWSGSLPIQEGTLVVYSGHAFTDQVTGVGGAVKRGVGRHVMADKMRQIFEAGRTRAR